MGISDTDSHEKTHGDVETSPPIGDVEVGEHGQLKRQLKGRHMQMIAIGGSIGAGLFVGAGSSLNAGGPLFLVIDYAIIGVMLLLTVNALGELACKYSWEVYWNWRSILIPRSALPCRWILLRLLCPLH